MNIVKMYNKLCVCVFLTSGITSFDNKDEQRFLKFCFWEFNFLVWLGLYNSRKFIYAKIPYLIDLQKFMHSKIFLFGRLRKFMHKKWKNSTSFSIH